MDAKLDKLSQENAELRRGGGSGVTHTADSQYGNFGGMVPARSVTVATRPVRENPGLYHSVVEGVGRVEGQKREGVGDGDE